MECKLNFRAADPSDAELLGRLNFQLIRDEGHRNPMSEDGLVDRVREWLKLGEYEHFRAKRGRIRYLEPRTRTSTTTRTIGPPIRPYADTPIPNIFVSHFSRIIRG